MNKSEETDREESRFAEMLGAVESQSPAPDQVFLKRLKKESTQAFLAAETRQSAHERTKRMRIFKKVIPPAAAACIVAGITAAVVFLTLGNGGATSAWAEVQERIRNARTCTFRMTTRHEGMPETTMTCMIREPGLLRQEVAKPENVVTIMDLRNGRTLSLREKQKKAMFIQIKGLPPEAAERFQEQNWMHRLKELIEESETELGEKEIDGRPAKGYQVDKDDHVLTAWVDTETGGLVKMEMTVLRGTATIVMSDFEFDKELDEKLFSMKPPPGYTMAEPATIELKAPSYEDVGVLLGVLAKMNDGAFPDVLPENPSMGAYMKDLKGFDRVVGEQEAMKVVMPMGRGIMFLAEIHPAGHYAGKGVKLGDAETAVFWYKPKDSETYKVIYGDLSVKDVAEEDLPVQRRGPWQ